MNEYVYTNDEDIEMKFEVDEDKSEEIVDLIFQYLRETGISDPSGVQCDSNNELMALNLVESLVEILDINEDLEDE